MNSVIIGSENHMLPFQHQAIILNIIGFLLIIGSPETIFNLTLIKIQ